MPGGNSPDELSEMTMADLRELFDTEEAERAAQARTQFHALLDRLDDGRLLRLYRFACLVATLGPLGRLGD